MNCAITIWDHVVLIAIIACSFGSGAAAGWLWGRR
jgi:hypothetical protein